MELTLTTQTGKASKKALEVSDAVFARDFNEGLVHQVVTAYMAAARAGTRAHKNRSAVSGGGAKPWRQKGTGRARAGTIRSPLWRSGGKTFAATPQDYSQKVNRKMYRAAISAIFSELVRQDRLMVVEKFDLEAPKTKELAAKLKSMEATSALILTDEVSENLYLSSRNLINVAVSTVSSLSPVALVGHEKVIITASALKKVEEALS